MENQHRRVKGYRELDAETIALMNEVREAGNALLQKQKEVVRKLATGSQRIELASIAGQPTSQEEHARFLAAEPHRWAAIAKTDIQTGVMALIRAIAQPDSP